MKSNNSKNKLLNISLLLLGLVLIFSFCTNSDAAANTQSIYVNGSSGNDAWDGTSSTHIGTNIGPKKTIKSGLGVVSAGGTVNIAGGTYNEHSMVLNKNMIIQGGSQDYVIIDAKFMDRIFTVKPGVKVTMNYLKLFHGKSTHNGGAIFSEGTLTMNNCRVKYTKLTGTSGGAILNNLGSLTVNQCDVSYNCAPMAAGIYTHSGTTTIKDSTLNYNNASGGAGGAAVNSKGSLTLINDKFEYNKATPGFGGAIYNYQGRLNVSSTVFKSNSSPKGGAAIYTQDSVGTVYFIKNTFLYNNAYKGRGGGLYHCHGTIIMKENIFTENKAAFNGGAIYLDSAFQPSVSYTKLNMENSTFTSNLAKNYGGAIYDNGTLTITNCTFTSNSASNISGGAITNAQGVLNVTTSTFKSNKAPNHYGGGIYNYAGKATVTCSNFTNNTAYRGGAMYNDHGSLTSTKNTFANNKP